MKKDLHEGFGMERHYGGHSAYGGITALPALSTEVWRGKCPRSREAQVLPVVGSP
ncbi:MAG: hypothetical protein QCH35_03465 [Methanomicrobiaceae archaeon]|nr:hypothetical protein [Methanomicrobiaceae archaeon]